MSSGRKLCHGFIFILALVTSSSAQRDSLRVLLLDAKSGNPLVGQHILMFYGDSTDQAQTETKSAEAKTGSDGFAMLSGPVAHARFVLLFLDWRSTCFEHPNQEALDIRAVVPGGLVINRCSKRALPVTPGVLTVAARAETFFEKMSH